MGAKGCQVRERGARQAVGREGRISHSIAAQKQDKEQDESIVSTKFKSLKNILTSYFLLGVGVTSKAPTSGTPIGPTGT